MKLSDLTPEEWYARLNTRRTAQRTAALAWWQYVDLAQPLVYMARIIAEQDGRFPPLLISWPELVLESVEERLIHEAFLLGDSEKPVDELNALWQANDLDEYSSEAHMAAMTSGQHFIMVGPGDGDLPMITVEYEDQVAVETDVRTGQPIASLKVWKEEDVERGALFLPGGKTFEFEAGKVVSTGQLGAWASLLESDHTLPSVPVVPILNKPRRGTGRSDLVAIKPLVDAANQFATNMMAAGEHHAVSRKWAVGATAKDFVDENGDEIPIWKVAMGDVWALPHQPSSARGDKPPETRVGQFTASDLSNFHNSVKMLATLAGSLYGLPPNYLGYSSDNPPSAESILYSLERLIRRTEKRQLWYGGSWKRTARIAWAIMQNDPADLVSLESKWRNASTPTLASTMDAAVKGVSSGIIDDEQAWVDLRYSEQTKLGLRKRKLDRGTQVAADLRATDQLPTLPTLPKVNGAPALGV